jgi:hypothetical protein
LKCLDCTSIRVGCLHFGVCISQDHFTALIDAVRMEQLEIAQLLLDHGALLEGAGEVCPALFCSILVLASQGGHW